MICGELGAKLFFEAGLAIGQKCVECRLALGLLLGVVGRVFRSARTVEERQLAGLVGRTGADELMVTTQVYDIGDRIHSLELIADKVAGGLAR